MKAINFLKSLLPNFSKSTVLEDLRLTKLVLVTVTQPSFDTAMRAFGSRKFENASLREDWEIYRRTVKGAQGPNTIVAIEKTLTNMVAVLDMIENLVEKDYNDDIQGSGVTYYKAAVLQMLESVSFASDYALKYLNYALVVETAEMEGEEKDVAEELNANLVPAELTFLKQRFMDFCTVMISLTKPAASLKTVFETIPDAVITEQGDRHMQSTIGASKLDPFMHNLIPVPMNLIYHARIKWADWQNSRHQQAKAEKEMLELRLLRMEKQARGEKNPSLEQQIEYTVKRLDDIRAHIRREEAAYA